MGRKSAKIAARKGASDRAKAQLYTRALKDVFKASKSGTPDIETNFLLRVAVERCKKFNVPKDNIDRAIKKGQGSDGVGYEDVTYEGYGPGGVAIFVEASTNNTTRTAGNVRSYFKKCHGSLGVNGSLEFIFERKALFSIPLQEINNTLGEDDFTLEMIDAGAEDIDREDQFYEVKGPMDVFGAIQTKLQEINITPEEAGLVRIPLTMKEADEEAAEQIEKLIALLEEDEDVTTVYDNLQD